MSRSAFIAGTVLAAGLMFACPSYAENAPKLTAGQVKRVVADAAKLLKEKGESGFAEFKKEVTRWEGGDTYIFVLDTEGNMLIHPDPELEGRNVMDLKDMTGRPIIKMFIETSAKDGEGWAHYMWPRPGGIFPTWKSTFVERVAAPSGKTYIIGCGIYNMKMEKEFIVDEVNEAASLIAEKGPAAFDELRDKAGPFVFFDTYVFVDAPDGTELVNGGFPGIEGKNIMDFKDVNGKRLVHDYIDLALKKGEGWVTYYWPKPGSDEPVEKHTYVKKVKYGGKTYIVGCGAYLGK